MRLVSEGVASVEDRAKIGCGGSLGLTSWLTCAVVPIGQVEFLRYAPSYMAHSQTWLPLSEVPASALIHE